MCPATYVDGGPRRAQPASPPPECGLRAVSSVPDGSAGNLELVDESSADLSTLLRRCAERHVAGAEGFQEEMVQIDASHASSSRKKSQKKLLRRRVLAALRSAGAAATPRLPSEPAAASAVSEGERSCVVTADNRELDIGIRHAAAAAAGMLELVAGGNARTPAPELPPVPSDSRETAAERRKRTEQEREKRRVRCPCEGARAWARPAAERVVLGGGAGRQEGATRAAGARGAGSLECGEQRARSCGRRGRAPQGLHRRAVLSSGVALGTAPVWACSIRRWRIDGHVLVWGGLRRWRVSSRHVDEQQLAQRPRAISAPPSASVAHNRSQLTSDQLAYLALKVPGEAARARLAASHETFRSQHGLPPSTQQKHGPALDVCHPTPDAYRCACCLRGPLPPAHGQADPSDGEWYCNGCWDEWAEPDVS